MHARTQPARNKLRSGRSAHQVTLTPSTALNKPISRQFTEMRVFLFINMIRLQQHLFLFFSHMSRVWQQVTNKSIRALISLICYDYVRQESTVVSLLTTPSAWCTYIACILHTQSQLLLRVRGGREGGREGHTQTLVHHCCPALLERKNKNAETELPGIHMQAVKLHHIIYWCNRVW